MKMNTNELYSACISKWGVDAQFEMLMEECIECALAVRHVIRGKLTLEDLASEVADVEIMIEQARKMLPAGFVDDAKQKKLDRLEERIKHPAHS